MILKTVSVKQVIAKVLTDNDMQEETHRIADMLTWCAEAIERIGFFLHLDTRVTGKAGVPLLEVTNYQAALPLGIHKIIQVAYAYDAAGPFYPMRYGTGSTDYNKGYTGTTNTGTIENPIYDIDYTKEASNDFTSDLNYVVTQGYIKLNKPDGYLMVVYSAIPLDEEGFPLVPDGISYIEALYWYVTMKLLYPGWKEGRVRDAVYYDARRSWNFYCKQAYGNALMPEGDMLESIKNTWLRLVPELGEHNGMFSTMGQKQVIYNANR